MPCQARPVALGIGAERGLEVNPGQQRVRRGVNQPLGRLEGPAAADAPQWVREQGRIANQCHPSKDRRTFGIRGFHNPKERGDSPCSVDVRSIREPLEHGRKGSLQV